MPSPLPAPTSPPLSDLIPERHIARLAGLQSPRIVIVGDSVSTKMPTLSHDMIDTFWGYFQRAFLLANPGLAPEFLNRAIGGTRYDQFAKARINRTLAVEHKYPWVDQPMALWFDEVEALQPDLLIQAFGMNDGARFDTAGFNELQARIDRWKKQPDRLFIPTMLPSRESDIERLCNDAGQNARLYVAHYIRSWALFQGYGIFDLNRAQLQAVQGFDPRVSDLVRAEGSVETVPSTAPEPCQDFGILITGEGVADDLATGFDVQIGSDAPGNSAFSTAHLTLDEQSHLVVAFSDLGRDTPAYLTHRSAEPIAAPERLKVFVKDVFAHVEIDDITVFFGQVRRHGGPFHAQVTRADGATSTSKVLHFTGQPRLHQPVLSDVESFGAKQPGNRVTGGNFRNHPSSMLAAYVIAPMLDGTRLTVPAETIPEPAPQVETDDSAAPAPRRRRWFGRG